MPREDCGAASRASVWITERGDRCGPGRIGIWRDPVCRSPRCTSAGFGCGASVTAGLAAGDVGQGYRSLMTGSLISGLSALAWTF
jgi:hypothetical protein